MNAHNGRYYATHSRPRKWFGKIPELALDRFRRWEAKHQQGKKKLDAWLRRPRRKQDYLRERQFWFEVADRLIYHYDNPQVWSHFIYLLGSSLMDDKRKAEIVKAVSGCGSLKERMPAFCAGMDCQPLRPVERQEINKFMQELESRLDWRRHEIEDMNEMKRREEERQLRRAIKTRPTH